MVQEQRKRGMIGKAMTTELIQLLHDKKDEEAFKKAGKIIKKGGLVAFPTETVYGLGGDALNPDSSRKIYEAKGRPSDNPLIVHIADTQKLAEIAEKVPETAWRLAEAFWPGPLTMILPKKKIVPFETTGGLPTVAIREPGHRAALSFIRAAGGFIAAPSANLSGSPSPTTALHVMRDLEGRIDMVLDDGTCAVGLESTIVDLSEDRPMILRPGGITKEALKDVIPDIVLDPGLMSENEEQRPKAPGMKYRHYAPKAELFIIRGSEEKVIEKINSLTERDLKEGKKPAVLCVEETKEAYHAPCVLSVGSRLEGEEVARRLYGVLREFDRQGVDRIYSEGFSEEGIYLAVSNRLLKAAGHKEIHIP